MSQSFTAGTRRMQDGSFLPFVDVVDSDLGTEWQQPHPQGCVALEAEAELRSLQFAQTLREAAPVESPAQRYRQSSAAATRTEQPAGAVFSRFVAQLNRHQSLLSGAERRTSMAEVA